MFLENNCIISEYEAKTKQMMATSAALPINNPNLRRRDVQIGERTFEVVPVSYAFETWQQFSPDENLFVNS